MQILKHRLFAGNIILKSTSKIKLTFNQILICRKGVMLLSKNMAVTCATIENRKVIISDANLQINMSEYSGVSGHVNEE